MKIPYDGQIYASQTAGGSNHYFDNIIDRLPQDIYSTLTTTYRTNKLHYPTHPNLRLQEFRNFRPGWISHRVRALYFRWLGDRTTYDIHQPTYYDRLTNQPFSQTQQPIVITVYDMIHELFADTIDPEGYTIRLKRDAIEAADAVICISESTKTDLLKYFPQVESKVSVTHLASEFSRDRANGDEPVLIAPYFLYVGGRNKAYKSFDTMLVAFAKATSINSEIHLCVVGSPFNEDEQQQINELKLTDRIHHYQYATDTHLAKLYRCAQAFIYPSLYEGFGIPPLEAMQCGTPVITSNTSSLPEVVGDAGIMVSPRDADALCHSMLRLYQDDSLRKDLSSRSLEQASQFSWKRCAQQIIDTYKIALS